MNEQNEVAQNDKNDAQEQDAAQPVGEPAPAADEFRLTIRKLEMPVRPRGVLAE
jgi:hypothetical protein